MTFERKSCIHLLLCTIFFKVYSLISPYRAERFTQQAYIQQMSRFSFYDTNEGSERAAEIIRDEVEGNL